MKTNDEIKDLLLLIETNERDAYKTLYETNMSALHELAESWSEEAHETTDQQLTLLSRLLRRICRRLDGGDSTLEYETGKLCGIVEAFEFLYRREKETKLIDASLAELLSRSKPSSKRILQILYEARNDNEWIANKMLEDKCSLKPNALSNIMKRLVQAQAVTFSKEGRNVSYRITPAGTRYYEQKIAPESNNAILQGLDEVKREIAEMRETLSEQNRNSYAIGHEDIIFSNYYKGNNRIQTNRIPFNDFKDSGGVLWKTTPNRMEESVMLD